MNYIFKCAYCDKPVATTTTSQGYFVAVEGCECETKNNKS